MSGRRDVAAVPDQAELAALARLADGVAREAGALLLGYYNEGKPSEKIASSARTKSSRTDLVTVADQASERLIVDRLADARPDDAVVAEEGASRSGSSGLTWLVDPLDGTTNFVYGFPAFAVSVGCHLDGGERLAGAVYDPLRDESFVAWRGGGATRDAEPVRLAPPPPLPEALVATGFGYDRARRLAQAELLETILPAVRDLRRAGAAALDLCWLAAGRVDAVFEAGLAPWDHAAGALVVTEAGGNVSFAAGIVEGAETIVAAADPLHGQLLELLRRGRAEADERAR